MTPSGIDANRREIASAACELVAADGLDNVSMRRIATSLGSTTGYISHYYADKEDLLEAALRAALDEITTRSQPQSTNLEEWIDRAVGTLPHGDESQRFWRVLTAFQAASLNSPRLAEVLRVYVAGQEAVLAGHLVAVVGGDPHTPGAAALARSLFALVSGLGTTLTITPGAFTPEQQRVVVRSAVFALVDEFNER
ncbi:TetR/AcrR family transcriptional regulator [Rhodococcus sp. IEGM 1408]|uniref:TetR/AcrR family transcriptional regulator n=1 Tax=Rhodococcus sp. IEGM 1408 TaxID=3082220 RepID=UPI002955ADF6|nr:TetR/AcrR family transcriptional regulator [Rhodococcus sp. IEGM 1408]MDV8001400.1 TetR/AcrR family transcriptional regulator [Rhodococcus sp. IEGM 1408]